MEKRQISFSPPDITEAEVSAVADVLRSDWITTGPRTKEFEKRIAKLCGTNKAVLWALLLRVLSRYSDS